MTTSTGEVAAVVAIVGMLLTGIGITGIDSGIISGAVNGIFSIITLVAAVVSWWQHRKVVNASV